MSFSESSAEAVSQKAAFLPFQALPACLVTLLVSPAGNGAIFSLQMMYLGTKPVTCSLLCLIWVLQVGFIA